LRFSRPDRACRERVSDRACGWRGARAML
jgi:hypothetical protein